MKIAYLAPEIPALSATFVYNEIAALKTLDVDIEAFSVHHPNSLAKDVDQSLFGEGVNYLYATKKAKVLLSNLKVFIRNPWLYCCCVAMLIKDVIALGVFSRIAVGQVMRFFYAALLSSLLKKKKCEHIHIHFAHVPTDIAMYASRLAGIGYSVTSHANDIFERGWLLKEKVRRSKFFATISQFNVSHLESIGVEKSYLRLIRCGVDSAFLAQVSPQIHENLIFKFGAVGRLVEKKGFDTLIRAAAILKERGVEFELNIAGSGPDEDKLKALACDLQVDERVKMPGALAHSDVADFCAQLDVFCLPCKTDSQGDMDGIPVVLMEAMLLQVPVISSRISGIPELILHEETGLLVEQNAPLEVANCLERLYRDTSLRKKLITKGKEHVEEEFTQVSNAKKLKALFEKLLAEE